MASVYSVGSTPIVDTDNYLYNLAIFEKKVAMSDNNINVQSGNYFTKTATGNITFTVSNVPSGSAVTSFILELTNGGSYTMNWSGLGSVTWAGGSSPTTSPDLTASGTDILGFYTTNGGSTWRGFLMSKDAK